MSLDPSLSPGQLLCQERERQNKTHNDIARQLRLTLRQVQALEEDSYQLLPGTTFVRGFMRNYAKLLGLDPEVLLRAYEASLPPPPLVIEPLPPAKRSPHLKVAGWAVLGLAMVVTVGSVVAWISPDFSNLNLRAQLLTPSSTTTTAPRAKSAHSARKPGIQKPNSSKPTKDTSPGPQELALTESPLKESVISQDPAATKELAEFTGAIDTQELLARLKFFFNEDAWVEVRDQDHQKVFSHLNIKGTEKVVDAAPPLTLVVGNARGVRITYNDNEVDFTPHIKNNIARFNLD